MAFHKIISRYPNDKELAILLQGYQEEYTRYREYPEESRKFLKVGAYPPDETLDPIETASMTHVANIIYNLDEAISKS